MVIQNSSRKLDRKPLQFTPRETEIMVWVAQGKNYTQISELLSVTGDTVRVHIRNACRKLNAKNKTHAIALAMSVGLISSIQPNSQTEEM